MAAKKISPSSGKTLDLLTDQYRQAVRRAWLTISAGEARIPLTQVFILLEAVKRPLPRPLEPRSDLVDLPNRMKRAGLESDKGVAPPTLTMALSQVLQQERHIALLGEPGSGKSTALQFIGLCFATDGWSEEKLGLADSGGVPVRLNLKEWAADLARPEGGMFNALSLSVNRVMEFADPSQATKLVFNWRDSGRLIVLLDGLDEVSDQWRSVVRSEIERLAYRESEQNVRLIVTSRPAAYTTLPESIKEFTLKPFSGKQEALPYLEKWLAVLRVEWDAHAAAVRLLDEMNTQPALSRLMDNPLLLRLSAEIYARNESIASSRADLYDKYIHHEAWPRAIQRSADPSLKSIALTALEQIAWRMQSGKILTQVENEILLREQMGLLVRVHNQFAFSHTTFQEYFVAQYLTHLWREQRDSTWSFLRPRLHLPEWREPLLLMAGSQEEYEAEELILRVLRARSRYEKELHRDLLLAASLLGERKDQARRASQTVLKSAMRNFRWPRRGEKYNLLKASEALVHIGSPLVVSTLLERVHDRDPNVRCFSAQALGQIGSQEAIPALIKHLDDDISDVRDYIARALRQIGSEVAIPILIKRLHYKDPYVRRFSAQALGQIGSQDGVQPLLERLLDSDHSVRYSAAQALGQLRSRDAVPALLQQLVNGDYHAREYAARALGEIGSQDAVPALIKHLDDREPAVRGNAARALGEIGSQEAIPALVHRLGDKEHFVRDHAAQALGQIAGEEAISTLIRRLGDSDRNVRAFAAQALGQIGAQDAVPALLQLLGDEYQYARASAAQALGQIGAQDAVPALLQQLKDKDYLAREYAARALGQIGFSSMPVTQQTATLRQVIPFLFYLTGTENINSLLHVLIRLETLEASLLETKIQAEQSHPGLRKGLQAGLTLVGICLVAGLIGLLMILASIFDDVVKEQWASGLQMVFATRPFIAPILVVLVAGLIALLSWSLAKLKERK